ncbi:hypothetical protein DPMN_045401 [Dreissena polymorpha]|uniref:Uncharacterized protein n=1 Tax=Dreissena polymorpha TaxID=45954 RepID=A0A9D4HZP6_DREPO|nr:hypothetical protein DPMN_045401 [Dreissena polymorpha]
MGRAEGRTDSCPETTSLIPSHYPPNIRSRTKTSKTTSLIPTQYPPNIRSRTKQDEIAN